MPIQNACQQSFFSESNIKNTNEKVGQNITVWNLANIWINNYFENI